jgi:hypothetical protein
MENRGGGEGRENSWRVPLHLMLNICYLSQIPKLLQEFHFIIKVFVTAFTDTKCCVERHQHGLHYHDIL